MTDSAPLTFRRPTEEDHPRVVGVVDEWWGGRRMRALLPRLWFQHFSGTSWLAEDDTGRLAGFVVAFVSQDDPTTGYVHMVAADPNRRRSGLGRALYQHVFDDLGYRRYEWKCHNENEPSKRTAQRLGFTFEGVFRQHMLSKRANRDTAWFSIIDSEWPVIAQAFEAWLSPGNFDAEGRQKQRLEDIRAKLKETKAR